MGLGFSSVKKREEVDYKKNQQQGEEFLTIVSSKFGEQFCKCREGAYTNFEVFKDAFSIYRDMYIDKPTFYYFFSQTQVFDIASKNSQNYNEDISPYITEINNRKYIINLELLSFPSRTTLKI
jgi:hypothetical protein